MESYPIPRIGFVMEQFIKIDKYKWYCRLLKEHARKGFTVYGSPVPGFVAGRMAYAQGKDNFGVTEMKDLLIPLCNATFLLNSQTPDKTKLNEFQPKYHVTFTAGRIREIFFKESSLKRVIGAHYNRIDSLRAMQKECLKLDSHLQQRESKLRTFLEKHRCDESNIPAKLRKQYNDLMRKASIAADKYGEGMIKFGKKAKEEREIRAEIIEKEANIKDLMTTYMREGITEAYADLVEAVCMAKEQEGYHMIIKQLEIVDIDGIVEALYKITSATYTSPLPMEFIKATGFNEKLSKIKYRQCDFKELGYKKHSLLKKSKNDKTNFLVSENPECTEDCFFPKSGGAYVSPVKRHITKSKNIMNIKPGYEVKMKLSLMNGTVGFGWTRRNFVHGIKKWGFYYMTEDKAPTFTPYDNLICTEDPFESIAKRSTHTPQDNVADTEDPYESISKRATFSPKDNVADTENPFEFFTKTPALPPQDNWVPSWDFDVYENDVIEV